MSNVIWGVVKGGLIVPQSPLPEGTHVRILMPGGTSEFPPEMQAEFDAWVLGSGEALAAFEGA